MLTTQPCSCSRRAKSRVCIRRSPGRESHWSDRRTSSMKAMSNNKTSVDVAPQHWVHSHEEDTDTEMVLRPAGYKFPPSRGRSSFELKPDGRTDELYVGRTVR